MENMEGLYRDGFTMATNDESELHSFLESVEEGARWEGVKCSDVLIVPCAEYDGSGGLDEEIIEDTLNNSGLMILMDGVAAPLGVTALKSIEGRARIHGTCLAELDKDVLAEILNHCLKKAKGNALVRWHGGKVRAVHAEREYSVLPMMDVFAEASSVLYGDFDEVGLKSAYYDHGVTTAVWGVKDEKLMEDYKKALVKHGIKADGDLSASVRVTTSDVGISGANVSYSLLDGNRSFAIGKSVKLNHRNKATIEDFNKNLSSVFARYKAGLEHLTGLMDKRVDHPENVMRGLMGKVGISKKLVAETVELFTATSGAGTCTAYEVYAGINECLFIAKGRGESERYILDLEEDVARILAYKWGEFDHPGELAA